MGLRQTTDSTTACVSSSSTSSNSRSPNCLSRRRRTSSQRWSFMLLPVGLVDLRSEPTIVAHPVHRTTALGSEGPFSGRSALVVGGSRGLGRAGALALAREGARVLATGRNQAALVELQAIARARGTSLLALRSNAESKRQLRVAFRRARTSVGGPDILVHAVG